MDVRPPRQMLTAQETWQRLGIKRNTLWVLVSNGKLKSAHIGRRLLFEEADVEALMDEAKHAGVKK